ncbi:Mn2+ and Fe2+ transporters of the NRAMP family [Ectothiorhodospira mobilis]|uniref:Mn2+ and Fe2+ transporters of the NRAMP family n=1 Tax=Ectothiorhodospira mobilis TaxID=195064 RepID=A0A1I4PEC7_ECTMO|nr:divalent metal cation transporter [Ectothiorhodospira mobilis]SFM26111.1 Mn2+ and Fe2+ transporters of the NRAMP family [Ectothiorhodospira mobilis]
MKDLRSGSLRHAIGPGLLMAGAAIGVSHLVQSTRAGAEYGLLLLPAILLACILKYPFLEFGPRYAAATGEHLLSGYRRLGRWALGLFALVTLGTMFIIQAVVTVVTAGLLGTLVGLEVSTFTLSVWILAACLVLLAMGDYRGVDLGMKLIMAVLTACTVAAVAVAVWGMPQWQGITGVEEAPRLWTGAGFAFLLALLGWMPIPLDVAVWHSLWTLERARETGTRPSLGQALTDFRIGFWAATLMAAAFLLLGALTLYADGRVFADSAVGFAGQLVDLYAGTLGEWSRPIIAVAALTTMFSTTLAVTDAYPRVVLALWRTARGGETGNVNHRHGRLAYALVLAGILAGALALIRFAGERFTAFIDLATTLSFLSAPVLAWLTLRVVTHAHMSPADRPGGLTLALAWAGLAFLTVFSLIWLAWRLLG